MPKENSHNLNSFGFHSSLKGVFITEQKNVPLWQENGLLPILVEKDFRQVWGCSKIRSKWNANLGRAPHIHFWAAALPSFSSCAVAWMFWSEMRVGTPKSQGETGLTFGIFPLSSPLLLGKKYSQVDMRVNFTFVARFRIHSCLPNLVQQEVSWSEKPLVYKCFKRCAQWFYIYFLLLP